MAYNESRKEYMREWRKKNKEREREITKRRKEQNPEKYRKTKREYVARRKREDPLYKLKTHIRSALNDYFKRRSYRKNKKAIDILGCSVEDFIKHLTKDGISIEDFGKYNYHIDHIVPLSKAKTQEEVIKLCHYTNFQPLYWVDNLKKSNKHGL